MIYRDGLWLSLALLYYAAGWLVAARIQMDKPEGYQPFWRKDALFWLIAIVGLWVWPLLFVGAQFLDRPRRKATWRPA